jgi:hypothetical protein
MTSGRACAPSRPSWKRWRRSSGARLDQIAKQAKLARQLAEELDRLQELFSRGDAGSDSPDGG